jgi:hypothetical protein
MDSKYGNTNLIVGGAKNCIKNIDSGDVIGCTTIVGGNLNAACSCCVGQCKTQPSCGFIGGGSCNLITNPFDFIVAGECNKICYNKARNIGVGYGEGCSFIVGNKNKIDTGYGTNMLIGHNNCVTSTGGYGGSGRIIGGFNSCILGEYGSGATILGGSCHSINQGYGSGGDIIGGQNHTINAYSNKVLIVGGRNHQIGSGNSYTSIIGGNNNSISSNKYRSAIMGGCNNTNNHSCAIMLGLAGRTSCTDSTTHVNCLNIQNTCGGTTGAKQVSILPGITSNGSVVTDMCEMCVAYNATQIQGVLGNGPNCVIIAAPGANKTLVIYEAIFQIQTSGTNTTQGFNGAFQVVSPSYNCNNTSIRNTTAALVPANVLQAAVRNGQTYTTYQRDAPTDGRVYSTNQCVRFGWSNSNPYPNGFPSVFICLRTRLRYKIYCDTAF